MAFCGMWMAWHPLILTLVSNTRKYSDESEDFDLALTSSWRALANSSMIKWDELVCSKSYLAEEMDAWDIVEQDLLMEDDDRIMRDNISMHVEDDDWL